MVYMHMVGGACRHMETDQRRIPSECVQNGQNLARNARRLERLLCVLLERKQIGANIRRMILFKCVLKTGSMQTIANRCTRLETLRFQQVVVNEKPALSTWLQEIEFGPIRELAFDVFCIAYDLGTEQEFKIHRKHMHSVFIRIYEHYFE